MSGSGSERSSEEQPFVESDSRETPMAFDKGGVPLYVAIIWVAFLAAYVVYMVMYGLPDLQAWRSLAR